MFSFYVYALYFIPLEYEPFTLERYNIVNWTRTEPRTSDIGSDHLTKAKYRFTKQGTDLGAPSVLVGDQCMQCQFRCH